MPLPVYCGSYKWGGWGRMGSGRGGRILPAAASPPLHIPAVSPASKLERGGHVVLVVDGGHAAGGVGGPECGARRAAGRVGGPECGARRTGIGWDAGQVGSPSRGGGVRTGGGAPPMGAAKSASRSAGTARTSGAPASAGAAKAWGSTSATTRASEAPP